ncbi:MAG: ETC complex I subunit [Rhizobiales bacterium 63-22]|nr:MAG: ETC complex I subunit [Rhizobiales bacterium 63-22]
MVARIYRPAKTAMQSGQAKTDRWLLEYEPESPRMVEPLMGYTSSGDMKSQIRLFFDTQEEAIAYAKRNGIPYRLFEPNESKRRKISYSDNFRFDRQTPWTH